jgi:hypothetical protein
MRSPFLCSIHCNAQKIYGIMWNEIIRPSVTLIGVETQCGFARNGESMKRIIVAILFGLLAGGLCASGAFLGGILKFSIVALLFVLLNRAVMGFAIGISGLKLHWVWNGIVVGMAVGSIFSYYFFMILGPGPLPVANYKK